MQIKNEVKGDTSNDGMELVWDEDKGEYVLKPVANTEQMTIFDADFRCVNDEDEECRTENGVLLLPSTENDDSEEENEVAEEIVEEVSEVDIEDEFFGAMPLPFEEGEYDYEEPSLDDF